MLRAVIQHHKNVSYIFTGSKQRLIQFFTSNKHPFYKFGKLLHIEKPNKEEMIDFIKENFTNTGMEITDNEAATIVNSTLNLPYFTQMLAHEVWNRAIMHETKTITHKLIHTAVSTINQRLQVEHESLWSSLTKNQRTACKILAAQQNPYQQKILKKYNISQSSLQQAINSLLEKQIIWKQNGKMEFLDPFFWKWIKFQFHI